MGAAAEGRGRESSVHLALFPVMQDIIPGSVKQLEEDWEKLLTIRTEVLAKLEKLRADKVIGKSLEAEVVFGYGHDAKLIATYAPALAELFNVSKESGKFQLPEAIVVEKSQQPKCERCWRYVADVGNEANYPTVCLRCAEALIAIGFAPYAKEEGAA